MPKGFAATCFCTCLPVVAKSGRFAGELSDQSLCWLFRYDRKHPAYHRRSYSWLNVRFNLAMSNSKNTALLAAGLGVRFPHKPRMSARPTAPHGGRGRTGALYWNFVFPALDCELLELLESRVFFLRFVNAHRQPRAQHVPPP